MNTYYSFSEALVALVWPVRTPQADFCYPLKSHPNSTFPCVYGGQTDKQAQPDSLGNLGRPLQLPSTPGNGSFSKELNFF